LWKGPEELLRAIDRYLQGEAPVIKSPPPADETLASRHEKIIAQIAAIKQKWNESVGEIEAIIENSGIDRRKFNRGNQGKWIDKISAWAQEETRGYQLPDALENSPSVSCLSGPKPTALCLSILCLLPLKPCWLSH
jgi:exodeoxyribonuclease V beta subunit